MNTPLHRHRFRLLAGLLWLLSFSASFAAPPAAICDRIRFQAVPGKEAELEGAIFAGSNVSRTEGFVTLAEIKTVPAANAWTEIAVENTKVYRYLRVTQPKAASGKLAKVEFYAGERLLAGDDKGIVVRGFRGNARDDQTVAYDLADAATAQRPGFQPSTYDQPDPLDVKITSTPGAVIRYTLDGSWPTAEHGETYQSPIHLEKSTTFSAVALLPDRAPSLLNTATFLLPGSSKPGLTTAHLGNSLTQTTGGFYRFARTAGYDHKSAIFARPGALTRELWAVASGEFAQDKLANSKETTALKRGSTPWADYWSRIDKIDLLTIQPRDFDLDKEIAAEVRFIKLFREKSPDLQPWLYCEWVEMARERPSDKGLVPTAQMKRTFPALTWEESMSAMLLYVEELQQRLRVASPEGKPARVLPTALAMGWMRNMIDHGRFPGAQPGSFYPLLFNDQVHPADSPTHGTANGAYVVDLTWFSAFYKEQPEGRILPIETTFTPEQARVVGRLAWDVIKNYPDCGLYENGTEPCGRPTFANDGKIITLQSNTPGAWFRYTLDGTTPTRTRGYVYCGAISVQPGIQVKAVAYKSGLADSEAVNGPTVGETAN